MIQHGDQYQRFWTDCTLVVREPLPTGRPIPAASEVILPRETGTSAEPLVPVDGPRVAGQPVYSESGWKNSHAQVVVRSMVRDLLAEAASHLPPRFGLAVADGWRPLSLQEDLYTEAYQDPDLPPGFVSLPDPRPEHAPPHVTGGTVDCTLSYDGTALALGTGFDVFSAASRTDSYELQPGTVRSLRRMLYWTLVDAGFVALPEEWWHYEYGTRRWSAVRGQPVLFGPTSPF